MEAIRRAADCGRPKIPLPGLQAVKGSVGCVGMPQLRARDRERLAPTQEDNAGSRSAIERGIQDVPSRHRSDRAAAGGMRGA
eukprot:scaffold287451_cov30-Tisochrysis_lutea.AAC.2